MGGPRITSGSDSEQDQKTPPDFMVAVAERWGEICFDLAAHAGNAQHERYFAPTEFVYTGTEEELAARPGALVQLFRDEKRKQPKLRSKTGEPLYEKRVQNTDKKAYGFNAFAHSWSDLTREFTVGRSPGLLWLNCEFNEIERWAQRCMSEAEKGAHVLLLTPIATTNWFRDYVQGIADTFLLIGRLSFDGKNPYPKDCMLNYFRPRPSDSLVSEICLWDWRINKVLGMGRWARCLVADSTTTLST
jgi:hypothetical protein